MDIQNTREYKAAQDLERALNDYGWNPERENYILAWREWLLLIHSIGNARSLIRG